MARKMANEKRAADTSSDRVDTLFAVVDGAPHHFCQQTKDNNFEDQLILRLTEQVRKIVSNNYKSHCREMLMLAGLPLDTLDLEEHGNLDDCNSPVKKKHKSASPKPSAHGLSEEELKRIDKLKKNELIAELDDLGGDYNKIWKKELLRDALLEAYAAHNNHAVETQVEDDERLVNKMDVIWESEENGPVDAEPRKNDEMDISLDLDEQKDKVPVAVSITISNKHPVTDGTSSYREIDSTKINSGTLGMELAPRQGAIERSFNKEEKKGVQGNNDVEAKVVDEICRSAVSLCMLDELCMPSVINSAHPKSCTKIHKVVTAVKIGEPTAVKIGEPMLADSDKLLQNKIEGISEGNKSEAQPNKSSSKHSVTYGDTTCCEDKTAKMTKEPFRDDPPSTQGMVKRAIAAKEKKVAVATARGSTEPESKNASENCTNVVSSAVSDKSEPPAANNTSMEIDEHKTTKSGMLDAPIDAHYSESQEFFSAQQSESSQLSINHTKKLAVQQYALTLTPIQGSVVKPPRSPSSVPCGLVDSIKKKLMASQTKQPLQHVHFPSIKDREEDHEKVVSKNLQHVRFPSMKDREEDNEKGVSKDGMTDVAPKVAEDPEQIGEVVSASERQLTTPMLSSALTKASSTKSKHVASDAFRATADARSLRLAQMKAKSKQAPSTLSKMTTVLDGAKLPTMPLTGPVSESKFALTAKERLKAEVRAKHLGLLAQAIRPPATTGVVVETKKHVVQSSLLLSSTATTPGKVDFVNYEMTDTESDSDDESETSQNKPAKRIPEWSRREKLLKALKLQYSCDYPIDPDVLFGEVETCDLEEVFNKKSKMYRRRNSSGDWTKDRVTSEEKLAYKLAVA